MGSQRKKIIQEMFEVSAKYLYRGGGGYQKSLSLWKAETFSGTTHCT